MDDQTPKSPDKKRAIEFAKGMGYDTEGGSDLDKIKKFFSGGSSTTKTTVSDKKTKT